MKLINLNTILIICGILFLYFCGHGGHTENTRIISSDTTHVIDTAHYTIVEHIIHHHDTLRIDRPAYKDSSELAADYFTERNYEDSMVDSNITGVWRARVWKNLLFDPKFTYQLRKPQTTIINNKTDDPHFKMFIGGFMTTPTLATKLSGGPQIQMLNKREQLLSFGYDALQGNVMVGYSVKISFR